MWHFGIFFRKYVEKILDFKLSPCFESCKYSFGYFPGVRLWFADVSEPSISSIFPWRWNWRPIVVCRRFGTLYQFHLPLKMELIEGSETSANHNRTPGKYPKEYIKESEHGESLKSRQHCLFYEIPARTSCVAVKWAPSCVSLPSGGGREN